MCKKTAMVDEFGPGGKTVDGSWILKQSLLFYSDRELHTSRMVMRSASDVIGFIHTASHILF